MTRASLLALAVSPGSNPTRRANLLPCLQKQNSNFLKEALILSSLTRSPSRQQWHLSSPPPSSGGLSRCWYDAIWVLLQYDNPIPSQCQNPILCNRVSSISSTCSFPQSHKWVIFRVSPCSRTIRACRNSVVEAGGGSSGEDLRSGTRKKSSLFLYLAEDPISGSILGDIVVLVTNKRGCGGAEFAREKGIPIVLFPKTKDESEGISPADLVASLRGFEVDFVLLAGYLKLLPAELIRAYPKSILNIHPSLLPAFGGKGYYGMKVHKAVVASGARFSGPTIHFVDEHYDTGRILAQSVVPVLPNDTPEEVATRVLQEEHRLYVEVVEAMCEDRIVWRQDGVPLIQSKENPNEYR
ncbi:hypothetical protein G4B88_022619 [Cannabis sativa]|uniref:phosphoribosylglycinamide formyltransferase 1 n=1 Tax=Cannabis sativa TaxID=3483 RepID=A0A7J6HWD4_CANSA|nr:hypothetical protein G4B88_022619 [Cannabis sativa]